MEIGEYYFFARIESKEIIKAKLVGITHEKRMDNFSSIGSGKIQEETNYTMHKPAFGTYKTKEIFNSQKECENWIVEGEIRKYKIL